FGRASPTLQSAFSSLDTACGTLGQYRRSSEYHKCRRSGSLGTRFDHEEVEESLTHEPPPRCLFTLRARRKRMRSHPKTETAAMLPTSTSIEPSRPVLGGLPE